MTILRIIENIFRSKTRSVLTMSGIAVGVFAVVLISAVGNAGTSEVAGTLSSMGINTVLVQGDLSNPAISLSNEDIETITRINGVSKAMPLMASNTETVLLEKSIDCLAWGVSNEAKEIISLEAKHGRLINSEDVLSAAMVCVLDEDIALATYGRSNIVGKKAKILLGSSYREFEVIGIAKSGISTLQSALSNLIPTFAYIPYTTVQNLSGRTSYDKVAVLLDENIADENITDIIETRLAAKKHDSGLSAANLLQQKGQLENILNIVTVVLSVIAGISLLVSGLTVMTTMLVSVGERKREIGIKKSIGAKNSDILLEFLMESAILTLIGSLAGTLLGLFTAYIGCKFVGITFVPQFQVVVIAVLFSLLMGSLFGAYPAVKAARLKPIDALRQ